MGLSLTRLVLATRSRQGNESTLWFGLENSLRRTICLALTAVTFAVTFAVTGSVTNTIIISDTNPCIIMMCNLSARFVIPSEKKRAILNWPVYTDMHSPRRIPDALYKEDGFVANVDE